MDERAGRESSGAKVPSHADLMAPLDRDKILDAQCDAMIRVLPAERALREFTSWIGAHAKALIGWRGEKQGRADIVAALRAGGAGDLIHSRVALVARFALGFLAGIAVAVLVYGITLLTIGGAR